MTTAALQLSSTTTMMDQPENRSQPSQTGRKPADRFKPYLDDSTGGGAATSVCDRGASHIGKPSANPVSTNRPGGASTAGGIGGAGKKTADAKQSVASRSPLHPVNGRVRICFYFLPQLLLPKFV